MKRKFTPELFLSVSPEWSSILRSNDSMEDIRRNLLNHVNNLHFISYSGASVDIHDLDLVIIRDCARVWRGILHPRSEELAGFSVLRELINAAKGVPDPSLSEGFWSEIYHLVLGIEGEFRLHESTPFSFTENVELQGRDAAIARSSELDLIHDYFNAKMTEYVSGLDEDLVKSRKENMERILGFTGDDEKNWYDWHWQLRNIAKDADTLSGYTDLSEEEKTNIGRVNSLGIPFGVTPYYASLFEKHDSPSTGAVRAQVLFPESYINVFESPDSGSQINDFMLESDTSPEELITRRYPGIVILKPYNSCPQICVYCQRNWEIKGPLEAGSAASDEDIEKAISWIREHNAISEVLITGGDPLVLSDERISSILGMVSAIPHVERIRIGTRTPVTLPMRLTEGLCDILASFRKPGRREIAVMTHIQHPMEVTPEMIEGVSRLKSRGVSVYNQLVFTFYISRRFEAAMLRRLIRLCGVDPYYSFYPKGKNETADYRVPIARILQEQKEESRLMPGLTRTDEPVYNVPGLGKNHLNAWQHRDLISVDPDGARVYEFHPWEKKVADRKTYIGRDVPILDYLKRLQHAGENMEDYRSIWYYF